MVLYMVDKNAPHECLLCKTSNKIKLMRGQNIVENRSFIHGK